MMKKVLCTLLMAAFISPLWAVETEAAPEQKLMPAIAADMDSNELGVVNDILRAASGKDSPFDHDNGRGNDDKWRHDNGRRGNYRKDRDRHYDDRWDDDDDDRWDDDRWEHDDDDRWDDDRYEDDDDDRWDDDRWEDDDDDRWDDDRYED